MTKDNSTGKNKDFYELGKKMFDRLNPHIAHNPKVVGPEQEPVAYGTWDTMLGKGHRMMMVRLDKGQDGCTVPLYTTPSQRKPLTDEEIDCLWSQSLADTEGETYLPLREFARAIEAKLKEKNNG